jgi:branched-chain amino acid transport system ATP-binding protein
MLRIEGVEAGYGPSQVLWGVDLGAEAGRITVLVGSNGVGKTTLLRTISGLLRAKKGSIKFKGVELTRRPPERIPSLGLALVPEGRQLFPELSVRENLLAGSIIKKAKARRDASFHDVYDLFPRLKERANQPAGTLSGGEQQMLAVARGLMGDPEMLVLDEPSLGLSPILTTEIFGMIKEICERGVSILLVEQNVRQSLRLADKAYVMENGRIVLSGKGDELLANPMVKETYLGVAGRN